MGDATNADAPRPGAASSRATPPAGRTERPGAASPAGQEQAELAARLPDAVVEATGTISEAYETLIRARGHLYSFHQLLGTADGTLAEGVEQLRRAGHQALADDLSRRWVGRNVLPGWWTFEVVEAFDDTYFEVATAAMQRVRDELLGGARHPHEARMKVEERHDGPTDDG